MTQNVNVQFTDSTQETIAAVFSCPQDETEYPNQAAIPSDDLRYVNFLNSLPVNVQRNLSP